MSTVKILHLSDIHFGQKTVGEKAKSSHVFSTARGTPQPTVLADLLLSDPQLQTSPDVMVLSGDITWNGQRKEYKYACTFLDEIKKTWNKTEIVLCPGNHDVDRTATQGRQNFQLDYFKFIKSIYKTRAKSVYPFLKNDKFERDLLIGVHHVDQKILIVTVNSASYLKTKDLPIFISPQVLGTIEDYINRLEKNHNITELPRIFVMHHHLLPFAEKWWGDTQSKKAPPEKPDSTIISNSGYLQKWLSQNHFSILLHGHKHQSHVRQDRLWRPRDADDPRNILIVGAGSGGVAYSGLPNEEPLGYNIISISHLAKRRYSVEIDVREYSPKERRPKQFGTFSAEIGERPTTWPSIYYSEQMDHCHAAISNHCRTYPDLKNFISIVDSPVYMHPPSARIGDFPATKEQVKDSFQSLHPEFDTSNNNGWIDDEEVSKRIKKVRPLFHFSHGPRLFSIPGREILSEDLENSPIHKAVSNIGSKRAYAGLFNIDLDVLSNSQPLPALVGVQFIQDSKYLDLVVTFRNLELSFWWVVNMYEAIKLLHWATEKTRRNFTPRRITFFSSIAEWKHDPKPALTAAIDGKPLRELTSIVLKYFF
ncbi:MAG: metallophosphoesterase, partial [Bdellovibrionota bacterium]